MATAAAANTFNDANFDSRLHQLQDTSFIGKQNNAFQRSNINTNYQDQLAKLKLGYGRSAEGFYTGLNQRGMLGSGIGAMKYSDRKVDYQNSLDTLANQKLQAQGALDLSDQGIDRQLMRGSLDIGAQRAASRNAVAANLPSMGGF